MPRKKGEIRAKKTRCTETVKRQRIDEVLRLRLDGAEIWDIREYVREQEKVEGSNWFLQPDENPMAESGLWRYIALADEAVAETCLSQRQELVKTHLAKRRNLYAKAVLAGDYRTALSCVRDEAELLGMYPPRQLEVAGKNGGPVRCTLIEVVTQSDPTLSPSTAPEEPGRNETGS